MLLGTGEIRGGYLYGSDKPGLGLALDEKLAAKYPLKPVVDGGGYPLDRSIDGTLVKP